ncbi:hypothetical protein B6N60_02501 [Richelia sinica FACHB-800]|uniref:Uncharacterized protein n=1 Tax=Richelia sinica FACHB-800 TaxID=1357546 RepID=A0A975T8F1_9NOST|nr:hypothetical protein B6N60_02501 [Richelia sinica FACHB-800]
MAVFTLHKIQAGILRSGNRTRKFLIDLAEVVNQVQVKDYGQVWQEQLSV